MKDAAKKYDTRKSRAIDLQRGYCYLVKEAKPLVSSRLFEDFTEHSQGLYVTRMHPPRLKEMLNLRDSAVIWLSHTPGKNNCNPTALSGLTKHLFGVLKEKGIVLLDGLEYLVIQNGFDHTLKFVEHLNEFNMQNKGVVLIPINPFAFSPKDLALLERNLEVLERPRDYLRKSVSDLMEKY